MVVLKSKAELEIMRQAARIISSIAKGLCTHVKSGVTTKKLDELANELILQENVEPAFKGYQGYPATICTSINEVIVHGIPENRSLRDGDILSLDLGIKYKEFYSDIALTVCVGEVKPKIKKLVDVTKKALFEGIRYAKVNNHVSDISSSIQNYVEKNGFSIVRNFVGHGIGRNLHEEPEVPNFGKPKHGLILKSGMVLAIEPMVNMGSWECVILEDGWTAVSKDRLPSAHFEHTIAITDEGPEILTSFN
ncbi:MAG: type I methionyl aminopeptidase [Candidatus Omnitrophota bacterium]|nr:type I methionyl aminopeptidase [Candidatus Omnitrophota bacterium]